MTPSKLCALVLPPVIASAVAAPTVAGPPFSAPPVALSKELVDAHDPSAERIALVLDRPNTHSLASLYAAFPLAEAQRLAGKLELHHTPKHGSWLNVAEIELSALQRQCLDQRIADRGAMEREVGAWAARRNEAEAKVDWQSATTDARTGLQRLYPAIHD